MNVSNCLWKYSWRSWMVQWWLSRKTRDFCLWLLYYSMWAILPIRDWRCQDIDQVLLHEIIFFCVFSSSEVLAKITSIRSKLPTAACWSREKKERKLWSQLTLRRKRLLLPDITDKSFTVFFVRWGVKFDRRVIRPLSYMCRQGERKACNRIVLWILISLLLCELIWPLMLRCVTTQVSVKSQIRVIKTSHFHFYW